LSTIDSSTKQILDVGSQQLNAVVEHKYGAEAARSAALLTGTAQNIAIVYIDMRGIGRKALLKRVGKEYVKGRIAKSKEKSSQVANARM
jgi:spartin